MSFLANNKSIKGSFLVLLGAMSYGVLATIVKYANNHGEHIGVLTFMQFFGAVIILYIASLLIQVKPEKQVSRKSKSKLILYGLTFGFTGIVYYLSLLYIPVSMAIILLMQSIWMGVVLEAIIDRKFPNFLKIIGIGLILIGTILATNLLYEVNTINYKGVVLGLLSAISYTTSFYASSHIAKNSDIVQRSLYLGIGGLIIVILFWNFDLISNFNFKGALLWGSIIAIFGSVIPPLLFTKGVPLAGIGLSSIISAGEIPISIISAAIILNERVNWLQWMGVLVIFIAVIFVNMNSFNQHDKLA